MIQASTIWTKMQSALDAEGFDRYTFVNDGLPAINYAIQYTTSLFNAVFEKTKLSAENLKDLVYVRCFMTSDLSRVAFIESETGHPLWSLIAVYSSIIYTPDNTVIPKNTGHNSRYLPDIHYVKAYYSADLLTKEQVNLNRSNPFKQGNEILVFNDELSQDAYSNWANYGTPYTYLPDITKTFKEIQIISNNSANQIIALEYLKTPSNIVNLTDWIEFPEMLINLLTEKALFWVSAKQGGAEFRERLPLLTQITNMDINNITKLF